MLGCTDCPVVTGIANRTATIKITLLPVVVLIKMQRFDTHSGTGSVQAEGKPKKTMRLSYGRGHERGRGQGRGGAGFGGGKGPELED